ncbi:superinfection immunity protein [Vibrio parahaemolyticus]|uniref:superinfection immunity protein n=1 Tax=Vibrio vulnificus TaxID=672 RepID=UPI0028073B11|nr:superinfection immunity protein [Vibrio vulnificus]EIA1495696.1 superinfection immunity protein [Vibrio parahaemolyticus]ELA7320930.1 superinfection immunity protein [Vibrio parahaemolyticus]MDS1828884.1 superinfection immunity protein [Vibrio vulnificus]
MSDDFFATLIALVLVLTIGLLPTIIAFKKNHQYRVAILIVNVVGGLAWGVGWLVAFIWCFVAPKDKTMNRRDVADEIEKLHELKEKGIISEKEFLKKKAALLEL